MEKVDNALFKKANETLWEKIKSYGFDNMKHEKQAFQSYCKRIDQDNRLLHLNVMEFTSLMRNRQKKSIIFCQKFTQTRDIFIL